MEIDNDVHERGGEFVMYLGKEDIDEIIDDKIVSESIFVPDTGQTINLTVTLDSFSFQRYEGEEHYDNVMDALGEIYRAFLVSNESTTVKELKNKNTLDIEKVLDTYIYYSSIRDKYE